MSSLQPITLTLDRRILEHPRAYHLRRMRAGLWLYLDLLARLPADAETFEVEPAAVGRDMGLPEGTVRSWLGHLRKAGYLDAVRLNGKVRVTIKRAAAPETPAEPPTPTRFFTVAKLQRALGEPGNAEAFEAALSLYPDDGREARPRRHAGGARDPDPSLTHRALSLPPTTRHAQED